MNKTGQYFCLILYIDEDALKIFVFEITEVKKIPFFIENIVFVLNLATLQLPKVN